MSPAEKLVLAQARAEVRAATERLRSLERELAPEPNAAPVAAHRSRRRAHVTVSDTDKAAGAAELRAAGLPVPRKAG